MSQGKNAEFQTGMRRFTALQTLFWGYIGTYYGYIIAMLNARGISSTVIGIYSAVMMLGSTIGQFAVSYACDRLNSCKRVFMVVLTLLELCCCALYVARDAVLMGILIFFCGFFKSPLGAVIDTWFIKGVSDDMRAFGRSRSGGSFGYSFVNLFYGMLLAQLGYSIMPFVSFAFMAALLILCIPIPDIPADARFERTAYNMKAIRHAVAIPAIGLLFAAVFLMGFAYSPVYNMLPVFLTGFGGTTAHQGIALFVNAGMEIPGMNIPWSKWNISPAARLLLAAFLLLLAIFLMSFANAAWQIIVLMGVTGFCYGVHLHARRALVSELAPPALQATMHGLGDMLYGGLGPIIGSMVCGKMTDACGMRITLLSFSGIIALSTVLMLLMARKYRQTKHG